MLSPLKLNKIIFTQKKRVFETKKNIQLSKSLHHSEKQKTDQTTDAGQ